TMDSLPVNRSSEKPAAFIFDVYGTLVDSVDLHARAWQEALADYGKQVSFAGNRFRYGTRFLRWRPDKAPRQCTRAQLRAESHLTPTLLRGGEASSAVSGCRWKLWTLFSRAESSRSAFLAPPYVSKACSYSGPNFSRRARVRRRTMESQIKRPPTTTPG